MRTDALKTIKTEDKKCCNKLMIEHLSNFSCTYVKYTLSSVDTLKIAYKCHA